MKLEDYELLIHLSTIGTVRGTAKHLYVSQPAITQRLRYIETHFQHPIFVRTSKKLLLTPVGEQVVKHAKEVVERENGLHAHLQSLGDQVSGTLSIGASSVVSQQFLPSLLETYTSLYPDVKIDLVTGLSEDLRNPDQNFHVRLIRGKPMKDGESLHLLSDPLYLYDTKPFSSEKERPLIAFKSDSTFHHLVDEWFLTQSAFKPNKSIQVDQIETCKQFMMKGLGMAVLPKSVASEELHQYPHLPLTLNDQPLTRETWLCFQKNARDLPQVDRFIQLVQEATFM
ncbi:MULTISPECIES: LysR family transcriptional regulator [Pontibacillus]|uniref:LysR family transcriptional regulator n=1 Tax=Pontibacillus chungwhensis TaxID=265426 RepID=A0ABY8V1Z8_9BACI|nr:MULTISPECIES: LysR family transcriptional regulator [Pontibacillus]MCD5322361.1 LysR family transcriptional regulator [Pontibacillus sp. HN14]WIF99650.1 LysR family transcriptional regulator [Pontibacillus chungwhensis]